MNLVSTSVAGMALFLFQLVIAMYAMRVVAVKFHHTAPGQAVAGLFW